MKKFIITVTILVALYAIWEFSYYRLGLYIDFRPNAEVRSFTATSADQIYVDTGNGLAPYEIRGVNMGIGVPGYYATEFKVDKKTYLRWFGYIKDMGANTIRVYTIQNTDFYEAFYEFNKNNDDPLYLIHGVWVNDYIQNSHRDAYDDSFRKAFLADCKTVVDVIHGKKKFKLGRGLATGTYNRDISKWVLGYILGVEWEDVTVIYTDKMNPEKNSYHGKYMYTTEDATPFEAMLANVGDKVIEYESKRYKQQRLVAFSNWPTTDPFDYPYDIEMYFSKCAKVDVEHIKTTDKFKSGQFASYHVYPYYPDYLKYYDDTTPFRDENGELNTYKAYLMMLTEHHTMPVIIAEYGVPSSRGMAQRDYGQGRNQGGMSEEKQGYAVLSCYDDIMEAGCAGGLVFTWQDEWFKRTWNTMHAIDLKRTAYWSDYQTNEQYFGLLSFDPGKKESICYVDGDISEWSKKDIVINNGSSSISMKYDEKFIYLLLYKENFDSEKDILYVPFDITPKTGSNYCKNFGVKFERESDFLLVINGKTESRLYVQERYEVLRAIYAKDVYSYDAYENAPDKNTPEFKTIKLILQSIFQSSNNPFLGETDVYETGLLTYGNANPKSNNFNSLADFIFYGDYVEVKLPWQILNFSNPSDMTIHDDYYEHYGVENISIDKIYIGIGDSDSIDTRIPMESVSLKGWKKKVTYHERLKQSYYIIKERWTGQE